MIIDENVSGYIRSLEAGLPEELAEIEKYGIMNEVPIIREDARTVLRFVLRTHKPGRVLEIGTAIGFSACLMAHYAGGAVSIDTIEKDEKRIREAAKNIEKTNSGGIIKLLEGDASEILNDLSSSGRKYDLVFLDAAKAQYPVYLPLIKKLLDENGILLTDNVLQEGSVAASKFAVCRRDRTIHKRMREFIGLVMKDEAFESMIIPLGDGMLISRKL